LSQEKKEKGSFEYEKINFAGNPPGQEENKRKQDRKDFNARIHTLRIINCDIFFYFTRSCQAKAMM